MMMDSIIGSFPLGPQGDGAAGEIAALVRERAALVQKPGSETSGR